MTRGAPGAGKSTFLRAHNLWALTVSPDQIRDDLGGLFEDDAGHIQRGAVAEAEVWRTVERDLHARMVDGRHVIIDATFQKTRDFEMPGRLAQAHGYRQAVLDFTMVPVEVALERNRLRSGRAKVPEAVIRRAYARFRKNKPSTTLAVIGFEDFPGHAVYGEIGGTIA